MKGATLFWVSLFSLWVAGILQVSVAPHLAVLYGFPDFCLIALGILGQYLDRRGATILGFGCGWVLGALSGLNLTLFILSRSIAGFLLGWSSGVGVQRNALVTGISAAGVTLISSLIMLFAGAHRGPLISSLLGTLVSTMYNGVIAAIVFGILSKIAGPQRQDRF